MALSTMTREWKEINDSIMRFVIRQKQADEAKLAEKAKNATGLFNEWVNAYGVSIRDPELALWCVEYMQSLVGMPIDRLTSAAKFDGIVI